VLGWPRQRLFDELQNGRVRYRTYPEGYVIDDWLDPYLRPYINVEASEISMPSGAVVGAINDAVAVITGRPRPTKRRSGLEGMTLGIKVLPPGAPVDAEVPPSSADAPAASPAPPRTVSDKDLRDCILTIKDERPNDPPNEKELQEVVESRLGLPIGRNRIRKSRNKHARKWVKPRGRPRKPAQF
jgi:hypothetical protein